ncbi:hypothetical protein M514_23829 [Trichuris suis]|uniref:Uncharacterized protein n=1 Tax=Trichuris suis TaxID=68888 RepID=A0A085N3D5_9BILA|nr:hypothetical protein M514_23829 [Trichuris suis]
MVEMYLSSSLDVLNSSDKEQTFVITRNKKKCNRTIFLVYCCLTLVNSNKFQSATAQSNGRRSDLSQHGGTQPDTKLSSPGRIMTLESSAESTEASGINQALPGDVSMRGTVLDDYINQFD